MSDEKITELPVATVVNASDVLPIVQSGTTKQAAASLLPGSFLSANTARVDPSGSDGTGMVGDLSKPFLTAQAALTALEDSEIVFTEGSPAVVLLPTQDSTEEVTTSLQYLAFIGLGSLTVSNPAIGTINLTVATAFSDIQLFLVNLYVGDVFAPNVASSNTLQISLNSALVSGGVTSSGNISVIAPYNTGMVGGTLTPGTGKAVSLSGLMADLSQGNQPNINAADGEVDIKKSYVDIITAAGSISMQDSVVATNNSGETPSRSDVFMNPINMDFSTLPTSEPTEVGKAWIDTMSGNVVKVKL